jgi:hypothetical protein
VFLVFERRGRVFAMRSHVAHAVALVLERWVEGFPTVLLALAFVGRTSRRTDDGAVDTDVVDVNRAGRANRAAGRGVGAFIKDDVQVLQRGAAGGAGRGRNLCRPRSEC